MSDDLFIDNERIQKMIAAGIYDEDMANKMKGIKNKDLERPDDLIRPASERAPARPLDRHSPFPLNNSRPRGRGFGRAQKFMPQHGRGNGRGTGRGAKWEAGISRKFGFTPLSGTANKWQELVPRDEEEEEEMPFHKRPRSPSPQRDVFRDPFRKGIRDGIQNKIQRNEFERKLNDDYFSERNAGNCSTDTDLRPKSDTDSRIRDTDLRAASNPLNNRKTAPNLSNITSAENDNDFKHGGDRTGRSTSIDEINRRFFGSDLSQGSSATNMNKKQMIDDIDNFIEKASIKFNVTPSDVEAKGRGRGRAQNNFNRSFGGGESAFPRTDDPLGLMQSEESYNRMHPNDNFDSSNRSPPIIEVSKEPEENPIAILKETVEELAKSNLYCQYCDCYLSSLVEVNTHIGTAAHQQNMTKKVMEENNNSADNSPPKSRESVTPSRSTSQTIVEKVPTGMAAIVQMIEQRKQITLKSLTEMDNYEIRCDSEASLAKELAKLLTNELLHYKMNLMPDTVKEALKHQGIGLINSMVPN